MTSSNRPTTDSPPDIGSAKPPSGATDPLAATFALGERQPLGEDGVRIGVMDARNLTDAEEREIIELLRLAFNGGPGWFRLPGEPLDHLRWKLREFPYESRVYVGDQDGRIVMFGGRLFRRWLVRGHERVGRDGVEAAIHPDLQGRSLSTRRREFVKQWGSPEDFSLSFASHPTSLHSRRKRGTQVIANPLENLVRPLDLARYTSRASAAVDDASSRTRIALEGGRRRLPRPALARRGVWEARLLKQQVLHRPLRIPVEGVTVRTLDRFDERIGPFFDQAALMFDLIQVRTQRFLNWRYTDPRGGPFTILAAESGGDLVGYAVTRATDQSAELADLLALPGRLDVAHTLLQDSLRLAREAGAPAMRAWMMRHHPYFRLLQHSGFLPIRRIVEPGFEARQTPAEELSFLAEDPQAPVHLMLGDTDHV